MYTQVSLHSLYACSATMIEEMYMHSLYAWKLNHSYMTFELHLGTLECIHHCESSMLRLSCMFKC